MDSLCLKTPCGHVRKPTAAERISRQFSPAAAMVASDSYRGDMIMITSAAGVSGCDHSAPRGPALLTDDEIAAVAGGIVIFPSSPPLGWRPESDPAPRGTYTP
jgi:hypothetical protein